MFQYVSMPVFTSIAIKIMAPEWGLTGTIFGTLILILVPVVYLIGEYHLLEIFN